MKIFIPGGAGLVGLNLIYLLQKSHPEWELLIVDKKKSSIKVGKKLFKNANFLCEDLSYTRGNKWPKLIKNFDICVMLQAEIGNKDSTQFKKNNVISTKNILKIIKRSNIERLIHVSSSVLNSVYKDLYTLTKLEQEKMIIEKWDKSLVILRPTLMFGWFDRKHLGWLQNFMRKFPIFPIPGNGEFIRQPLFVGDFSKIILSCIINKNIKGSFDITGLQQISYRRLMYLLKKTVKRKPIFIFLPISIFGFLLRIWAFISNNPAFLVSQLEALTAGDEFEVIDWPKIFNITSSDIEEAIKITYNDATYSNIKLPF